jgi:IS30 family transposase
MGIAIVGNLTLAQDS